MLTTILSSSIIASLVTALCTFVIKWFDRKREDEVRQEEREEARKDRRDEREETRKDRQAEIELEDRRERDRAEVAERMRRQAERRERGEELLSALNAIDQHFDNQAAPGHFRTYSHARELYRPVWSAIWKMPDEKLREYAGLTLDVMSGLWVPARLGEGPEDPAAEQRRFLKELLEKVTRFTYDDEWDPPKLNELQSTKDEIDQYWEELESVRPSGS